MTSTESTQIGVVFTQLIYIPVGLTHLRYTYTDEPSALTVPCNMVQCYGFSHLDNVIR